MSHKEITCTQHPLRDGSPMLRRVTNSVMGDDLPVKRAVNLASNASILSLALLAML